MVREGGAGCGRELEGRVRKRLRESFFKKKAKNSTNFFFLFY